MKKLNLSEIELSKKDKRRNIRLPEELTTELAEDIGIMVGDGCIFFRQNKHDYDISVMGHLITDKVFIKEYVNNLKRKLFNVNFRFTERHGIRTCFLRTYSKGLFNFYTKTIKLPIGSKKETGVPEIIMNSDYDIKKAFLRGLADTDMTLVFKRTQKGVLHYPQIKLNTASKKLVLDIKKILEEIGFKPTISCDMNMVHSKTKRPYITNCLCLMGKKNLEKWVQEIGFNNPKNILRYSIWKKEGFSLENEEIERIMSEPRGIFNDSMK